MAAKQMQDELRGELTQAILDVCQRCLQNESCFSVEGLLGLTLGSGEVVLINLMVPMTNTSELETLVSPDKNHAQQAEECPPGQFIVGVDASPLQLTSSSLNNFSLGSCNRIDENHPSQKKIRKDRNHEQFWDDYDAVVAAAHLAIEHPSWNVSQLVQHVHNIHKLGLNIPAARFAHYMSRFIYSQLDNRLYLRDTERICVTEEELNQLITDTHTENHASVKEIYETLKDNYYPCNFKKFNDFITKKVIPHCEACSRRTELTSSQSISIRTSQHISPSKRRSTVKRQFTDMDQSDIRTESFYRSDSHSQGQSNDLVGSENIKIQPGSFSGLHLLSPAPSQHIGTVTYLP